MSENTETTETVDKGNQVAETATETPQQLPDDHPLVKTLAAQKEQIRELKERTQQLDELEQANLTEQEKAEARVKAAEERAAELEIRNNIAEVAIEYGLTQEDAHLLKGVSDIETMRQIAERLAKQVADQAAPRAPRPHPAQRNGDAVPDDHDAAARAFFGLD